MARWHWSELAAALLWSTAVTAQTLTGGSDGEALITAVTNKDGAKAMSLVEKEGARLANYRGYDGETALHVATRQRSLSFVQYLIAKGADPNIGDRQGDTALIIAARMGFDEAAGLMLARQGNPNATNRKGETPLIAAVQQRRTNIVKMLLEAGGDPDKADHAAGLTAREYAKRDTRNPQLLRLIESTKSTKQKAFGPVLN